jgi:hypothetical protein
MLRNDYTVPTRCRHRGEMVDPLGCKSCKAIRQPITPSNQLLDHSIQNHPKPVSFLSSGVSSESSLTPLNPTITHTQSPYLASIASLARFVKIDFFGKKLQQNVLPMVSTEISSIAAHNITHAKETSPNTPDPAPPKGVVSLEVFVVSN